MAGSWPDDWASHLAWEDPAPAPDTEPVISKHGDHLFNVFTEALCRGQPGVRPMSGGCGDVNYDVVTSWKTELSTDYVWI